MILAKYCLSLQKNNNVMKILRKIFAIGMLMTCSLAHADNYAYLTIGQEGGQTSVQVSQISKITFDADNMIIHLTDGTTQQMPLATLSKMFFTGTNQGIAAVSASKDVISLDGTTLRLQLADGEQAAIYDLRGVQVFTANESVEFQTSNLRKGVYIVRVGNMTKKIMTR